MVKDVIAGCAELNVSEKREITDKYAELVFYTKDTDKWSEALSSKLGVPVKPAGVKPADNDEFLTKDFGGVMDDQTLFKKECGDNVVLAMFWPWQDGEYTTLKVISQPKNG